MASTYSTSLKLTLIGDGDQAGIWGQTTNTNLGTLLEQAITGVQTITMADANYTLTSFNGITDEARNAVLVVTGANNAVRDLIPPVVEKLYTIVNNTTGGYDIRVIGASGTGVNIPNGATCLVYCNGTNFYSGLSGTPGNFTVNGTATATNLVATTNVTATSYLLGNNATITNTLASANITATSLFATTSNATTFNGTTANATTVNATTVNATTVNATTANAVTVTIGGFNITANATALQFKYGSTVVMSMDSTGNLISGTNITAYGTP
jgi:hypothetical protein